MKIEKIKKIQIALLVIASILFIVGLVLSNKAGKERAHNVEDISVKIVEDYTAVKGNRYYVYTDFEIRNNSKETVKCIQVTSYFTDKNGRSIGTMTSTFGSNWSWDGGLELDAGKTVINTTYLEQSYSNWESLFEKLYKNGVSSYDVRYEITYVLWSDDYEWSK